MSFESDLFTYLLAQTSITSIVSTRCYPNVNNDVHVTLPYVTVTVFKERQATLRGPKANVKATVYFDSFSNQYLDTVNITQALVNVLHGYVGLMGATQLLSALMINEQDKPVPPPDDGTNVWTFHREAECQIVYSESPALQSNL